MALSMLYANEDRYRTLLGQAVTEIKEGDKKYLQMAWMSEPDRLRIGSTVLTSQDRREMNLIYPPQSKDEEPEEIVLNLQGFVVQTHLPPVTTSSQLGRVPSMARQTVTLSGIGTEEFAKALLAIVKVEQIFETNSGHGDWQHWEPRRERGYPVLTVGNRYLSASDGEGASSVADMDVIDPYHILREAVPSAVHTTENQVLYFERRGNDLASSTYHSISPSSIKIGDLVEAQVAFSTITNKKGKQMLLTKLRAICVLSRAIEEDMNYITLQSFVNVRGGAVKTLKRKVGYNTDGEPMETRMKKLKLTDHPAAP